VPRGPESIKIQVSRNVWRRHGRQCAVSRGKRCSCTPVYFASLEVSGKRFFKTHATEALARVWVDETRRRASHGLLHAAQAPTLRDAAISFVSRARTGRALTRSRRPFALSTVVAYERSLRVHVLDRRDPRTTKVLGATPVDLIDAGAVQRMVDGLTGDRGGEVARYAAAALSAVLRDSRSLGQIDSLPPRAELPPPAPGRVDIIDVGAADRLVAAATEDDERLRRSLLRPLVSLLLGSGLRITEAISLVWGSEGIDLANGSAVVRVLRETTKTDAGARHIRLGRETTAILLDHWHATGEPPDGTLVFRSPRGAMLNRNGAIRAGFARITRNLDLGVKVTPHLLRHAHGSWLASSGRVSVIALAAQLGHRDPSFTLRRYIHAMQTDLEAIPGAMDEFLERQRREQPIARRQDSE
jgi:integrase